MCLLGYIAYGVHLRNQILIFQGKPGNGPACHPVLGTGLQVLELLATFKLTPQSPDDVATLESRMEELHKDASGRYLTLATQGTYFYKEGFPDFKNKYEKAPISTQHAP